ncbi:MAG: hypothetical protein HYZ34_08510 [Ignavibacteriae bacterium]|nr:hypothetical protein [Ignavibacteriota bacterium]
MNNTQDNIIQYHKKLVTDIFKTKESFHKSQAQLPIEEKIRIMIELQRIELTLRPKLLQNDRRIVWTAS